MTVHVYGNGANSTSGANTKVHFYDIAGVKAANAVNIYSQFADKKSMPQKSGKTFKISKFLHMYDRAPGDADFATKGYMTARTAAEVSAALSAATLAEGAGAVNQRVLEKITMSTTQARYGEMIEFTDEVDMFSEDEIQVRYREELAALANSRYEDLLQMDMLGTSTKNYSGTAVSKGTIGDMIAKDGSEDDVWKVSYDLLRRSVRTLVRNRAKKNTSILTGSTKIGTQPVNAAYYAIVGADVKSDLENLTRGQTYSTEYVYVPAYMYAGAGNLAEGEIGKAHDIRFVESERAVVYGGEGAFASAWYNTADTGLTFPYATQAEAVAAAGSSGFTAAGTAALVEYEGSLATTDVGAEGATKFDVHPILFPTQNAFATVGLKGQGKINFNAKGPGEVSIVNPYGTKGFFSYNFFYAGILLEAEKVLVTLVAASK